MANRSGYVAYYCDACDCTHSFELWQCPSYRAKYGLTAGKTFSTDHGRKGSEMRIDREKSNAVATVAIQIRIDGFADHPETRAAAEELLEAADRVLEIAREIDEEERENLKA